MVASPPITNPFPGLRPFDLDEEHLFFGREGQADELLARLNQTGFLAVVGTSGSGKSSLVRAGLLPSLYSGFLSQASSHWRVALMRPGNAPIGNLAEALNQPDVLGRAPDDADRDLYAQLTETTLRRGDLGLVEVVKQARMAPRESLLLVIDQFEELFRFKRMVGTLSADDEAAAFVKLFLAAVRQQGVPIYVVLTMRSDFLGDCAQFRDLPEAINDGQYLIPRMTRDQRRSAIEGPVAVGGATITPRLVNRVLNDMGDNPDQLPILQHALMRTWRRWVKDHERNEPLDLRHYEAIGGMAQALSQHADEIYQALDDRSQTVAEKLFKCLTEKGPDNREIRRPTPLGEVCAVAAATPAEVIRVVEVFRGPGRSFLMPPVGDELTEASVLDISHESFMRVWRRLKDWVDEEAQSAQIYRRLAETAGLHGQGKAGYLQDPELTIGLTWRRLARPNEIWAGRYASAFGQAMQFLDASAAEQEQVRRRKTRTLYSVIGGLIVLSGLALSAAGFAYFQREEALKQRNLAEQRGNALAERGNALEAALTDAKAARKEAKDRRAEAEDAQKKAETANAEAQKQKKAAEQAQQAEVKERRRAEGALVRAEVGEAEAQRQAQVANEQRQLAEDKTQQAETQRVNSEILAGSLEVENLMAANLNFKALLTGLELAQEIKKWEQQPSAGQIMAAVKAQGKSQVKFASGGGGQDSPILPSRRLQAVSALREVYYLPGYLESKSLAGHSREVYSVSFAPDGQTLASASSDGTVILWDTTGRQLQTLEGHSSPVLSVSFAPDGQTLASASSDGTVILWNFDLNDLITRSCGWISDYLITHPQDLDALKVCQTPLLLASAAPALVTEALQSAHRGNFEAAVEQLRTAQTWDSTVDLDPETDAVERDPRAVAAKLAAPVKIEAAQRLARQGDVEGAVTTYREALAIDSTIDLDPSTENIQETDPIAVARRLVATTRVERGKDLAQNGEIEEAILAYQQAQEFGADITAADWEVLCWNGSRHNAAARVLFACDNGLALAPDNNKWLWESRGIARALLNNLTGAAQDLQIVVDWLNSSQTPFFPNDEWRMLRQGWLSTLQNRQNPFTPDVIEHIPAITLKTGDVQVTLDWAAPVDLDLDVIDPNGDRVDARNLTIPSGGQLERDVNCPNLLPTTTQFENVFWPVNSAPLGNYTAQVNFFGACGEEGPTSIDFSLNLLIQGQLQTFTGTVTEENPLMEFEFSVPSRP